MHPTSTRLVPGGLGLKGIDLAATFRPLQFDITTVVCLKQLGALLQIMTLFCSVVVPPAWYGKLSNVLEAVSLPIQINSPCAHVIQSQPKYVQGLATILLISVVTSLMAVAPFVPFVKLRLATSTTSKIQKLAGYRRTVCISLHIRDARATD